MPVDWLYGLAGGGLIGLAAAIFLLVNGRIMGASGIVGGLVDGSGRAQWQERSALICGLFLAPALVTQFQGDASTFATGNFLLLAIAGVLVGLGTRIANGCTSGHGVCGISRLSLRGIVASIIYIGAGALTVIAVRMMGVNL